VDDASSRAERLEAFSNDAFWDEKCCVTCDAFTKIVPSGLELRGGRNSDLD
jgi:hypothetical protein